MDHPDMTNFFKVGTAFLFIFCAMTIAQRAEAAFTATLSVDGLNASTYKPLSMPTLSGSNFAANGKVLINGKLVTIPGYIPPAPTAAQAVKNSLWNNPWMVGVALLTWVGDAGLGSDQVGGWVKTTPAVEGGTVTCAYYGIHPAGGTCAEAGGATNEGACNARGGTYLHNDGQRCQVTAAQCYAAGYTSGCSDGMKLAAGTATETTQSQPATTEPATKEDFDALPDPPPEVYRETAPQVGVPVDDPVYYPADIEIGQPYTRPDGSTAQPMAKVSPAGAGQVTVDTYDLPLTDSSGQPIANPTPQDTGEQAPAENQCDKYPDSLGCANLDVPNADALGTENRDISLISPVTVGGSGQCPAPLTASVLGHTVEMSFDPLCQYANALRPLVLSLAWLSAGVIFIGGVRNG